MAWKNVSLYLNRNVLLKIQIDWKGFDVIKYTIGECVCQTSDRERWFEMSFVCMWLYVCVVVDIVVAVIIDVVVVKWMSVKVVKMCVPNHSMLYNKLKTVNKNVSVLRCVSKKLDPIPCEIHKRTVNRTFSYIWQRIENTQRFFIDYIQMKN